MAVAAEQEQPAEVGRQADRVHGEIGEVAQVGRVGRGRAGRRSRSSCSRSQRRWRRCRQPSAVNMGRLLRFDRRGCFLQYETSATEHARTDRWPDVARQARGAHPRHVRGHRAALRPAQPPAEPEHRPLLALADDAARAARRRRARSSTCAPAPATWPWPTTGRRGGRVPIVGADFCHPMLARAAARRRRAARPSASASSRPTPSSCRSPTTRFRSPASRSACAT